jgi:hypothetical protein
MTSRQLITVRNLRVVRPCSREAMLHGEIELGLYVMLAVIIQQNLVTNDQRDELQWSASYPN